ncbi:MAG: peptidase M15 [Acidocella sp. 20-61-6]|nr:MAG: peptidase M15 [Acidocella sp. 20-61-6]
MNSAGCLRVALAVALLAPTAPALAKKHVALPGSPHNATATPAPTAPLPPPDSPTADKNTPTPPVLPDMTAYVLMDATTGAILGEVNADKQLPPASLTKLMTAYITYEALAGGTLKLDQTVPVSPEAWHAGGSRMFIDPQSSVTVDQLLHGLIIDSGNDAAVALAEQIAGSQSAFVQIMNRDAAALGLDDTHYTNVDGLPDPALRTSALDVAKLSRVLINKFPQIIDISKQKSYTYDHITQASWNPVLTHDDTVDGLKTGLTDESGHCIDATAMRGGDRMIAVVMGGPTWSASTAAIESLLDYGQKFFKDVAVAQAGQPLETFASDALERGNLPVGTPKTVTVTLPTDAANKVTHDVTITADLKHGATKGEVLGTVTYTLDGKTIATSPVVALADARPATFFTKLKRRVNHML